MRVAVIDLVAQRTRCIFALAVIDYLTLGPAAKQWRLIFRGSLLLLSVIFGQNSDLMGRFNEVENHKPAYYRIFMINNDISELVNHPLLGSAFVEPLWQTYPHNLIIETHMAITGITTLAPVVLYAGVQ